MISMETLDDAPRTRERFHVSLEVFSVAAVLLVALALRLFALGRESVWYDELVSASCVKAPGITAYFHALRELDHTVFPVYFTIQYYWAQCFGAAPETLRLLSVAGSVGGMLVVYALARRLYGKWGAFTALLFAAGSNIHIFYAQEIRVYAVLLFFCVLSFYALVAWQRGGGKTWAAVYYAASLLLLGTHLLSPVFLLPQAVFVVQEQRRWKPLFTWAVGHVPAALAVGLWMVFMNYGGLAEAASYMTAPTWKDLLRGITWDGAYLPHACFGGAMTLAALPPVAWLGARAWRSTRTGAPWKNYVLLLTWLVLPPVIFFCVSQLGRPMFVMRYWLPSSFALFLLFGGCVASLPTNHARVLAVSLIAFLLGYAALTEGRPFRPNYAACGGLIVREGGSAGTVLFYSDIEKRPELLWPGLHADRIHMEPFPHFLQRVVDRAQQPGSFWAIYCRQTEGNETGAFEERLRAWGIPYTSFPIDGGSPTFVYMALARHNLAQRFTTTVYRVQGRING